METIILFVVVVGVIGALAALVEYRWQRKRPPVDQISIEAPPSAAPAEAAAFAEPAEIGDVSAYTEELQSVIPVAEEVRLARDAANIQDRWERERQTLERSHHEEMRPILERLQRAREILAQSGVGIAVCDILRIMWYWPSWSKLDDWDMPIAVEGFDGGGGENEQGRDHTGEIKWLRWRFNGERYRLSLAYRPTDLGRDNVGGDLRLWIGTRLVMHLEVSQRLANEPEHWILGDVNALYAGPWMVQLNDFAGRLGIADRRSLHEFEAGYFGEKARRIAIG